MSSVSSSHQPRSRVSSARHNSATAAGGLHSEVPGSAIAGIGSTSIWSRPAAQVLLRAEGPIARGFAAGGATSGTPDRPLRIGRPFTVVILAGQADRLRQDTEQIGLHEADAGR
jgi:hypothetical protein